MRELLHTKHFTVTVDDQTRVLRRTRSSEPFASIGELRAEYEALLKAMDLSDRIGLAQLIDTRVAPPRNDPEFEAVVAHYHAALYRGFRANAVLVASAVGKLHVKRMLDASSVEARVFTDEAEALAYFAAK